MNRQELALTLKEEGLSSGVIAERLGGISINHVNQLIYVERRKRKKIARPSTGANRDERDNVARVREYLMNNLGCLRKEVIHALGLNSRTVARAIRIIRSQA